MGIIGRILGEIRWKDVTFIAIDEDNMASDSDMHFPTQQSVKAYVDGIGGGLSDPIEYNAATNTPDLDVSPSGISAGDFYYVTVAGTFFTTPVNINDHLIATKDNPTIESDWIIGGQGNIPHAASHEPGGSDPISTLADLTLTGKLNLSDPSELTISSGAITITRSNHDVDTEADAATDNLDTINGGTEGDIVILRPESSARTVVVTSAGNIRPAGGTFDLDDSQRNITLIMRVANWHEIARNSDVNDLADPGFDALATWDNTTKSFKFAILGTNLSYDSSTNTVNVAIPDFTELKFLAGDIVAYDDKDNKLIIENNGGNVVDDEGKVTTFIVHVRIPPTYKATGFIVYSTANIAVELFENQVDDSSGVSLGSGSANSVVDTTDVDYSTTNYLSILMTDAGADVQGGKVFIEKI